MMAAQRFTSSQPLNAPDRGAGSGSRGRSGRARPTGGSRRCPRRAARPRSPPRGRPTDRKSTRLNSSHTVISYAVFCLKKKKKKKQHKNRKREKTRHTNKNRTKSTKEVKTVE